MPKRLTLTALLYVSAWFWGLLFGLSPAATLWCPTRLPRRCRPPDRARRAAAGPCPRRSKGGTARAGFARLILDNLSVNCWWRLLPSSIVWFPLFRLPASFGLGAPLAPPSPTPLPVCEAAIGCFRATPLHGRPGGWWFPHPRGRQDDVGVVFPSSPPPPPPFAQVARRCAVDGTGGSAPCGWHRPPSWPPTSFSGLPF